LQNVSKYAGSSAIARIEVREDGEAVLFEVADDGEGFDPESRAAGAGLTNMRDRVGAIGGTLRVDSAPGRGTTISGLVPFRA
jgi:signal transduction histidine kinase